VLASPVLKDYVDSLRAQGYRIELPAAPGMAPAAH